MSKTRSAIGDAFSRSFSGTADIVNDRLIERRKEKKQEEERQNQFNILKGLLNVSQQNKGLTNFPNKYPFGLDTNPTNPNNDYLKLLFQADDNTLQRYKLYQDMNKPKEVEKDEYNYLDFSKPDGVYGFNKRTQTFEKMQDKNPIYKLKKIDTVKITDKDNQEILREIYEDGSHKDYPTGVIKKETSTGTRETYDPKKFDKVLSSFTEQDIKVNKLKAKLSDPFDTDNKDALKYEINSLNESNQSTLYNLLDDKGKEIVNEWYSQLKTASNNAGKDFTEIEKSQQEKLKKKFQQNVLKNYDGTSESYQRNRALILYSNFKYGYIY